MHLRARPYLHWPSVPRSEHRRQIRLIHGRRAEKASLTFGSSLASVQTDVWRGRESGCRKEINRSKRVEQDESRALDKGAHRVDALTVLDKISRYCKWSTQEMSTPKPR